MLRKVTHGNVSYSLRAKVPSSPKEKLVRVQCGNVNTHTHTLHFNQSFTSLFLVILFKNLSLNCKSQSINPTVFEGIDAKSSTNIPQGLGWPVVLHFLCIM